MRANDTKRRSGASGSAADARLVPSPDSACCTSSSWHGSSDESIAVQVPSWIARRVPSCPSSVGPEHRWRARSASTVGGQKRIDGDRPARSQGEHRNKLRSVAQQRKDQDARGVPDALRTAIERTFAATAEGTAGPRHRAGEVLDEVARRGRDAGRTVAGRAQEARETSAGAAGRVIEAIEGMRLASRDDVRALSKKVDELSRRVKALESKAEAQR